MIIEFYNLRTSNVCFKCPLPQRIKVAQVLSLWFGPLVNYDPLSQQRHNIADAIFEKLDSNVLSRMAGFSLISGRMYFLSKLALNVAYKMRNNFFVSTAVLSVGVALCGVSVYSIYSRMHRQIGVKFFDRMDEDAKQKVGKFLQTGKLKSAEQLILNDPLVRQSLNEHVNSSVEEKVELVNELDGMQGNIKKLTKLVNMYSKQVNSKFILDTTAVNAIKFIDKYIINLDRHSSKLMYAVMRACVLPINTTVSRTVHAVHKFDTLPGFQRFQHLR